MADFSKMKLTKLGEQLLATINSNVAETLTITKIEIGNGTVADDEIYELIALKEFWLKAKLGDVSKVGKDKTQVSIQGEFSNKGQTTTHKFKELGLYARGKNGPELLFAYANAGDTADDIPAETSSVQVYNLNLKMAISSNSKITGILDSSVFVTMKEFEKLQEKVKDNASKLENLSEIHNERKYYDEYSGLTLIFTRVGSIGIITVNNSKVMDVITVPLSKFPEFFRNIVGAFTSSMAANDGGVGEIHLDSDGLKLYPFGVSTNTSFSGQIICALK